MRADLRRASICLGGTRRMTVAHALRQRQHQGLPWSSLFWTVFNRSGNAMALLDERRRGVEVTGALLKALGYRRDTIVGRPAWEHVKDGPHATEREWQAMLRG